MRARLNKYTFVILILIMAGCAADLRVAKNLNFIPGEKALTLAVIPFFSKTVEGEEVMDQVREEVTANLYEGNYKIIELSQIDTYLSRNGIYGNQNILEQVRSGRLDLNCDLDADLIIQGRVIEWTKTYLAVHSDIELDVELFVFDAKNGKLLAKIRKGMIKNSGISRLPVSFITAGTAPLLGLRKSVQQEVIHTLSREVAQPVIEMNNKPKI